jgi:hypothetical protein
MSNDRGFDVLGKVGIDGRRGSAGINATSSWQMANVPVELRANEHRKVVAMARN